MFVLVKSNHEDNSGKYKARRYYLPKGIMKTYNVVINGKKLYDQPVDSDVKGYKSIRKLTSGEGYIIRYLLYYDYIKNHYKIISVDLSRK